MNAWRLIVLIGFFIPVSAHAWTWKSFGLSVAMADEETDGADPDTGYVDEEALNDKVKKTAQQLARENTQGMNIKKEAQKRFRQEGGEIYDRQRVEFLGFGATDKGKWASFFEDQVIASHTKRPEENQTQEPPGFFRQMIDGLIETRKYILDGEDATKETMDQALTPQGSKAVAKLKGKKINEIYAHSWGSEVAYNAILTGAILPPKKIVVLGVPERDLEKWALLSQYTGTEVVFVRGDWDLVQLGGEGVRKSKNAAGDALRIGKGVLSTGQLAYEALYDREVKANLSNVVGLLPLRTSNLERVWKGKHKKKPGAFMVMDFDGKYAKDGVLGHYREAYYGFLAGEKVLKEPWRKMRSDQNSAVEEKKSEIWGEAIAQANAELAEARELKQRIDAQREARQQEEALRLAEEQRRKDEEARQQQEAAQAEEARKDAENKQRCIEALPKIVERAGLFCVFPYGTGRSGEQELSALWDDTCRKSGMDDSEYQQLLGDAWPSYQRGSDNRSRCQMNLLNLRLRPGKWAPLEDSLRKTAYLVCPDGYVDKIVQTARDWCNYPDGATRDSLPDWFPCGGHISEGKLTEAEIQEKLFARLSGCPLAVGTSLLKDNRDLYTPPAVLAVNYEAYRKFAQDAYNAKLRRTQEEDARQQEEQRKIDEIRRREKDWEDQQRELNKYRGPEPSNPQEHKYPSGNPLNDGKQSY